MVGSVLAVGGAFALVLAVALLVWAFILGNMCRQHMASATVSATAAGVGFLAAVFFIASSIVHR